jgi:hypothetical protein
MKVGWRLLFVEISNDFEGVFYTFIWICSPSIQSFKVRCAIISENIECIIRRNCNQFAVAPVDLISQGDRRNEPVWEFRRFFELENLYPSRKSKPILNP